MYSKIFAWTIFFEKNWGHLVYQLWHQNQRFHVCLYSGWAYLTIAIGKHLLHFSLRPLQIFLKQKRLSSIWCSNCCDFRWTDCIACYHALPINLINLHLAFELVGAFMSTLYTLPPLVIKQDIFCRLPPDTHLIVEPSSLNSGTTPIDLQNNQFRCNHQDKASYRRKCSK